MRKNKDRSSEGALERKERLEARRKQAEAAIIEGLQRETARHEAVVKNMHRLRAVRLERENRAAPALKREAEEDSP
jgi:hypothetical protein